MNAVITNTAAWRMPLLPSAALEGLNGAVELPPSPTIVRESAVKAVISIRPRMIPALAERRMSKYVRQNTMNAVMPPQNHQPGEPVHQPSDLSVRLMNQPFRMKRKGGRNIEKPT
jgi:hypothetical protein